MYAVDLVINSKVLYLIPFLFVDTLMPLSPKEKHVDQTSTRITQIKEK